jgi:hypothetical protein
MSGNEPSLPADDRDEAAVGRLIQARARLKAEIARVVVGQDQVPDEILMALARDLEAARREFVQPRLEQLLAAEK